MKRFIVVITMVVIYSFVAPKQIELKDRAIVQAIGIDYIENKYSLTVLYYSPSTAGGEESAQTNSAALKTIYSQGESLQAAFSNISSKTGKVNYYGHNNAIIIGQNAAQLVLDNVVSYISGNFDLIANIDMLIAQKSTANSILTAKIEENIMPTQALQLVVKNAKQSGIIPNVKMIDVLSSYVNIDDDTVIPNITIQKETDQTFSYDVSGCTVYRSKDYAGVLSKDDVIGINLLKGQIESFTITLKSDKLNTDIKLYNVSSKTDKNTNTVRISCCGLITDISPLKENIDKNLLNDITILAEKRIIELSRSAYNRAKTKLNTDVMKTNELESINNIEAEVKIDVEGSISLDT